MHRRANAHRPRRKDWPQPARALARALQRIECSPSYSSVAQFTRHASVGERMLLSNKVALIIYFLYFTALQSSCVQSTLMSQHNKKDQDRATCYSPQRRDTDRTITQAVAAVPVPVPAPPRRRSGSVLLACPCDATPHHTHTPSTIPRLRLYDAGSLSHALFSACLLPLRYYPAPPPSHHPPD